MRRPETALQTESRRLQRIEVHELAARMKDCFVGCGVGLLWPTRAACGWWRVGCWMTNGWRPALACGRSDDTIRSDPAHVRQAEGLNAPVSRPRRTSNCSS